MSSDTLRFSELALSAPLLQTLEEIGYESPSPIQAQSIPHLLNGDDLLGIAQTGTGKTAAFALPLLSRLDLTTKTPQVLVLTPTRELAIQVAEAFKTYARHIKGFNILPIYGGQGMDTQLRQLRRGVNVVVGTPGRVMDHLRRKTLKLDDLKTVVLDEADEMLRMGFIDDVSWILEHTPEERQVALFSATMPGPIRKLTGDYLNNPKEVRINAANSTVSNIEQCYWRVSGLHKLDALTRILETEETDGIIIFVRTKTLTVELTEKLEARGYSSSAIHGDMTQALRERSIEQLKSGKTDIVVATDVAARGIDVARVSHVINYDIPYDAEAYVHRIGRTGRAGRSGKAILFVAPREQRMLQAIERSTKQKITPMTMPTQEEMNIKRVERFKSSITEALEKTELDFFHNIINEYLEQTDAPVEDVCAALAYLAQKSKPLIIKEAPVRERKERKDRPEKGGRGERKPRASRNVGDVERYELAVGRQHKVRPGDIVGAIANETGISSQYIGDIRLFDDHSVVELPKGMPKATFEKLKRIRVRNQPVHAKKLKGGQ